MRDRFVSIVTGASRGIGAAIAAGLAASGSRVALVGRDERALTAAAEACPGSVSYVVDVTSPAEVEDLVDRVESDLGPVDVLVNNAGIGRYGDFLDLAVDEWKATIETNLLGAVYTTRAVLPGMIGRGGGRVINVASRQAIEVPSSGSAYVTSKAALATLSSVLAKEVAGSGVQISVVHPGGVSTGFGGVAAEDKPSHLLSTSDVAEAVVYVCTTPDTVWIRDLVVLPVTG